MPDDSKTPDKSAQQEPKRAETQAAPDVTVCRVCAHRHIDEHCPRCGYKD